jgi:hypothetical protein
MLVQMDQEDDREIITALDGRQVDTTKEIGKLIFISRHYSSDAELTPDDSQFIHRFGLGLMVVCGPGAPINLADDMEDVEESSPMFATYLREKWGRLIAQCS